MADNKFAFYNLLLDFNKPQSHEILVKKGDNASRTFVFTVLSSGKRIELTENMSATIRGIRPDSTVIYELCDRVDVENQRIIWIPATELSTVPGKITCELELFDINNVKISSFDFYINVENLLFDENDYVTADDVTAVKQIMLNCNNAMNATITIKTNFEATYDDLENIRQQYISTLNDYSIYIETFKDDVAKGKYNGARGPQGEKGDSGVGSEVNWPIGFTLRDGDLYCHYVGDEEPENVKIDDNGHLVIEF